MIKHTTTLILSLLLGFSVSVQAQDMPELITIRGVILSVADSLPVPYVNITSSGSDFGTISNDEGFFYISVMSTDTLTFSSVNHQNANIPASRFPRNEKAVLFLIPTTYNIQEVTINEFSKEWIRDQILNGDIPPDPYDVDIYIPPDVVMTKDPAPKPKAPNETHAAGGIGLGNMLDFKAKDIQRQKDEVAKWQNRDAKMKQRYGKERIQSLVPVPDEEIEDFKRFCNLPDAFILNAPEYDLMLAIKECYVAYHKVKH